MSATLELPARRKNITPAELRALIKQTLGYNARQVTVSVRSSISYLSVTIRDAAVDVKKVEAFAKSFHTWTMDNTDYCEGQSVQVYTTDEVKAAHAAPFIEEIVTGLVALKAGLTAGESDSFQLSTGAFLFLDRDGRDVYVMRIEGNARGNYVWAADALALSKSCVIALALQAANI